MKHESPTIPIHTWKQPTWRTWTRSVADEYDVLSISTLRVDGIVNGVVFHDRPFSQMKPIPFVLEFQKK